MTGTPQIEERSEADTHVDWYQAKLGSWLPTTSLEGAPLERIRLPDHKQPVRTQIYYDALLEVCDRPAEGPVVAQLLTNIRPQALPWLRKLRNKGVATLYSVSQFPTWPQRPVKRLLRRRGYQQVYNEFDALVTNSEVIKEFLREIGVTIRIEYIPNGVDLQRFHPANTPEETSARQALRSRFGIRTDHLAIVVVGAIMPRKKPDLIIQAWRHILAEHPKTHLLFVGPRADIHDPKLKKFGRKIAALVESSGAPGQIHFVGIVDNVVPYLRAADIFLLASVREGTPNSLLEAMAVGLPSLVTPFIGMSAGIGRAGEHYQLVEHNPKAISAALVALLDKPELRRSQGERGQRYVTENMDQHQTLDRYTELYLELGTKAARRH